MNKSRTGKKTKLSRREKISLYEEEIFELRKIQEESGLSTSEERMLAQLLGGLVTLRLHKAKQIKDGKIKKKPSLNIRKHKSPFGIEVLNVNEKKTKARVKIRDQERSVVIKKVVLSKNRVRFEFYGFMVIVGQGNRLCEGKAVFLIKENDSNVTFSVSYVRTIKQKNKQLHATAVVWTDELFKFLSVDYVKS